MTNADRQNTLPSASGSPVTDPNWKETHLLVGANPKIVNMNGRPLTPQTLALVQEPGRQNTTLCGRMLLPTSMGLSQSTTRHKPKKVCGECAGRWNEINDANK